MLYVTDINNAPVKSVPLAYKESNGQSGVIVTVQARVYETDTSLSGRFLTASLLWNDDSAIPISFGEVSLDTLGQPYWQVTATRRLQPGSYVSVLRAQNFRAPVADTVNVNYFIAVSPSQAPYTPPHTIFGPILPRDSGFPNNQQWEFQINSDIIVLESSVKMLLLTAKGDRVMEPDYGTNIRSLLFESNIPSLDSLIREEIVTAFSTWEPRVDLTSMSVTHDTNNRSVTLDLTLTSKLNRQPFQTNVEFVR